MDDFYIYLPSNTKSEYFENTSTNFKIKLASRLNLIGDYKVGLAEISYAFSWMNINTDETIKLIYYTSVGEIAEKTVLLNKGRYNINDLLQTINKLFTQVLPKDSSPELKIITHDRVEKVQINLGKNELGVLFPLFSDNLSGVLGINKINYDKNMYSILNFNYLLTKFEDLFGGKQENEKQQNYIAESPYDINGGYHTLFVYSDAIKPHLVGNSFTRLIKFVEIPNDIDFGDQVHIIYSNIEYYPLSYNEVESIEIDIKDDTGQSIPFSYSRNVVVLHFKKIINNNKITDRTE